MLMPLSRAVWPALRPCSTTNGRPSPSFALANQGRLRADQEISQGPCCLDDERVAALTHQVEAQIGHIDVRSALARSATVRTSAQSAPGFQGSSDRAGQRQRQHFACAKSSGARSRSSSVNETVRDAPVRFTESPHDVRAELRRAHEPADRVSQPVEDAVVRPARNRDADLRAEQVARKRLELARHFHGREIARIEPEDVELLPGAPNPSCSRSSTPDSSAKSSASIVPLLVCSRPNAKS